MKNLEKILKALANRRRLQIIKLLLNNKWFTVTDIACEIGLSVKATSQHLAILLRAEVLENEKKSLYVYYKINSDLPALAKSILPFILKG
jgi:DNA-binding transcriptional ArsR family regulator